MKNNNLCFFLSVLWFFYVESSEVGYYWKDYQGVIPADAYPVVQDGGSKPTYIAQIYVHNYGLFIGQIFPSKKEVEYSCYGPNKTDDITLTKILCVKDINSLAWLPTNASDFHCDTKNKQVLIGGYNGKEKGTISIGRVIDQGVPRIGAVASFNTEESSLYLVFQGEEHIFFSFDVLIYTNFSQTIDIRMNSI